MPSRNGERLLKFCQIWSHWTWGIIQWKYPWIVPLTACLFCYPEEKLSRYIFGKIKMGQNEISNRKLRSRIFEKKNGHFLSFSREDLPLKMIIFVPISFQQHVTSTTCLLSYLLYATCGKQDECLLILELIRSLGNHFKMLKSFWGFILNKNS